MIRITINYSLASATKEYVAPISVRSLIQDQNLKALLGFGEDITALIDGERCSLDTLIYEESEVTLEKKAAEKA